MEFKNHPDRWASHLMATLVTWSLVLPTLCFDCVLELYHNVVFRLLKIPLVDRKKYIVIWDRTELQYLTFSEKLGCALCGYGNGLAHYFVVIAAETEKYWCGIKHKNKLLSYQKDFIDYGDEKAYRQYPLTYSQRFFKRIMRR